MYRKKTTTGRRTVRTARANSSRRRPDARSGGGGLKQQFERAAERPAKKWVQVHRRPASNITFLVKTWVPYAKLTEEEREEYDRKVTRGLPMTLDHAETTDHGESNLQQERIEFKEAEKPSSAEFNPIPYDFQHSDPSNDFFLFDAAELASVSIEIAVATPSGGADAPSTKRARLEAVGSIGVPAVWEEAPNAAAPSPSLL